MKADRKFFNLRGKILFASNAKDFFSVLLFVALLLGCSFSAHAFLPPVCYVNATATGANDGSSWTDAYTNPQFALLNHCSEIWVAKGVYKPTFGTDPTISFVIGPNVGMYGGFAGGETSRDTRDPTHNVTILSGDLADDDVHAGDTHIDVTTDDIRGTNTHSVVVMDGTITAITASTILNGFTITGGDSTIGGGLYCNGAEVSSGNIDGAVCSPTLGIDVFSGNRASVAGGGMYDNGNNGGNSSPSLTDVVFTGNSAPNGGGMFNTVSIGHGDDLNGTSNPRLFNVTFDHNTATNAGGAMYNIASENGLLAPSLANVTFSFNTVTSGGLNEGGGIYNDGESAANVTPSLTNATFFQNSAGLGGGIYNTSDAHSTTSTTLTNVTFNFNTSLKGGAIYNNSDGGNTTESLENVILWADVSSVGRDASEVVNSTSAKTIISDSVISSCPLDDGGTTCVNIFTGDPKLGPLADNGGFTKTLLLEKGSSAIDTANDVHCPTGDQRGIARPQGPHCDIGAVEVMAIPPPVATPLSVQTIINTPIQITLVGTDINPGGPFTYILTSNPFPADVKIAGNIATYTPDTNFVGNDSFTYQAIDSNGISNEALVQVKVVAAPPVAQSLPLAVPHNTTKQITLIGTDSNPGTFVLTYALKDLTTHGTVTLVDNVATYKPMMDYTGPDAFTYTVTDINGLSEPATVTIQVAPAPPTAVPLNIAVPYNTSTQITLAATDSNIGDGPFTYTFNTGLPPTTPPAHGTLSAITGNLVTYTPTHNYSGIDSFTYTATDINGVSIPALVTITIAPPGPPPPDSKGLSAVPALGTWSLTILAGLMGLLAFGRLRCKLE